MQRAESAAFVCRCTAQSRSACHYTTATHVYASPHGSSTLQSARVCVPVHGTTHMHTHHCTVHAPRLCAGARRSRSACHYTTATHAYASRHGERASQIARVCVQVHGAVAQRLPSYNRHACIRITAWLARRTEITRLCAGARRSCHTCIRITARLAPLVQETRKRLVCVQVHGAVAQRLPLYNRHACIRITAWLTRLARETRNATWKRSRNRYADLLLLQLRASGRLSEPFDAHPPSGPLPNIPRHCLAPLLALRHRPASKLECSSPVSTLDANAAASKWGSNAAASRLGSNAAACRSPAAARSAAEQASYMDRPMAETCAPTAR